MTDGSSSTKDEELYLLAGKGDESAFEKLVRTYQHAVFGYFLRRLGKKSLAEELAQELFLRLWKHAPSYEARSRFQTFLYRIAHNLYVDHCRRAGARPNELSLDSDEGSAVEELFEDDAPSPQESISREEMKERLHEALQQLPEREREILLLTLENDLPYREIAEILDIPEGTVKSRMHSAVSRLRRLLSSPEGS